MTIEEVNKYNFMILQYQNDFNSYAQNNQAWVIINVDIFLTNTEEYVNLVLNLLKINSTTTTALQFTWYNGDTVNTSFWGPGQPDNVAAPSGSVVEGCLSLSSNYNYQMSDEDCTMLSDYYCEYY